MPTTTRRLLTRLFGVALLALAAWQCLRLARQAPSTSSRPGGTTPNAASLPEIPTPGPAVTSLDEKLRAAEHSLLRSEKPTSARQGLATLRAELAATPTAEASATIRRFLDSKSDAPTGQAFKIGPRGFLEEAPTLRTWLLDYLGQVDPTAAARYARLILNTLDSADEWAISLRSLALGDPSAEGRALLRKALAESLLFEPWQQNPSAGYLEAFDVAVYLGGTNLVPALAGMVRKQNNAALAHAAYLALDRLVINDAAEVLAELAADPGLMQGREQTRANYFARADVRDSQQRQVLEQYLLDPRTSNSELDQFAALFPNANFMVSYNLLTSVSTPDHGALAARDAESLRLLNVWLADPRFAGLQQQLQQIRARLEGFVKTAESHKP